MIYLDKEIEITWSTNTRNYYVERGYVFTGWGDTFLVKVRDLPRSSKKKIPCRCDYCGKDYWAYPVAAYRHEKQCCRSCAQKPMKETMLERYGVDNASHSKELTQKARNTMKERYGAEYSAQSAEIREKIHRTIKERYNAEWFVNRKKPTQLADSMKKKYGVDNPSKVPALAKKIADTMEERYGARNVADAFRETANQAKMDKYGTDNMMANPSIRKKYKETLNENFGVDVPIKNPIVRMKVMQTNIEKYNSPWYLTSDEFVENRELHKYKGACSRLQYEIFSHIGGTLEAPAGGYRCDILKDGFDIEIDGGGHWLDVIHGKRTLKDKLKADHERDREMQKLGYKVLRIRCKDLKHLPKDAEAQIFRAMQERKDFAKLNWK